MTTFDLVISLCDGIGLARDSLRAAGIYFHRYVGVELDETARAIADYRAAKDGMPGIERPCHDIRDYAGAVGDARSVLLIAGIPCTERSTAYQKKSGVDRVGEDTDSGGLVREFAKILSRVRGTNARVEFIVENVPSAPEADSVFSELLGVLPVAVNAAAFSAQHRERLFWASWQITPPPLAEWSDAVFADIAEDNPQSRHYDCILYPSVRDGKPNKPRRVAVLPVEGVLKQIKKSMRGLPDGGRDQSTVADAAAKLYAFKDKGVKIFSAHSSLQDRVYDDNGKIKTIPANGGGRTEGLIKSYGNLLGLGDASMAVSSGQSKTRSVVSSGIKRKNLMMSDKECRIEWRDKITTAGGKTYEFPEKLPVVVNGARALTITEIERLFGLPDGATAAPGVSRTARMRACGGGWHIEQMAHCLRGLDKKKPSAVYAPLIL